MQAGTWTAQSPTKEQVHGGCLCGCASTHPHTHARTHIRTHAYTHAHTRTQTYIPKLRVEAVQVLDSAASQRLRIHRVWNSVALEAVVKVRRCEVVRSSSSACSSEIRAREAEPTAARVLHKAAAKCGESEHSNQLGVEGGWVKLINTHTHFTLSHTLARPMEWQLYYKVQKKSEQFAKPDLAEQHDWVVGRQRRSAVNESTRRLSG